ncbi:hypothetical protein ABT56_16205 [Photobacterium aquae]|uniref:YtxH domain-containing protein n=1 Tax=Photobacterium aquae TaxID=1195763 RepID=A0A0J1GWQ2_9GAMM|nr:hypothetical protein [Photobacterium aquae]KLV04148.1 hypothetical protein ABT56_16205 [Photobacterium aquae]
MLKYIVIALVGLGVYIGMTYKDDIEDLMDSRSLEEVHDVFEDMSDKASDSADSLSEAADKLSSKFEELTN